MANNLDAPLGFRPVANGIAGTAPRLTEYSVKAAVAIYEGDLVGINTTGQVIAYTVTDADAGDVIGVAAHPVTAAQSARELLVYDDPAQVYEAQADDSSLTVVADYLFMNFAAVKTTGNTTTLQSKHEIDGSTASNTFTTGDIVRVIGVSGAINNRIGDDPDNTGTNVSYTRFLCQIIPSAHIRSDSAAFVGTHAAGIG